MFGGGSEEAGWGLVIGLGKLAGGWRAWLGSGEIRYVLKLMICV